MLDANVERERRIRALVVVSLGDDHDHGLEVGASANVRLDTADKNIYTHIQVEAVYIIYK